MIFSLINELIDYSIEKKLISELEIVYSKNLLLDVFNLDELNSTSENINQKREVENILIDMCNYAISKNIITNSFAEMELLNTRIMNCVTPRPNEVIKKFEEDFSVSPELATLNFYNFSKNTNYIPEFRIKKNLHWYSHSEYGDLEITINLAKPEKDPKDIEREKNLPASSYPKCLLCLENVGYRGRLNHPARQTHRVIPINLKSETWYLQFSPYVYYNEHSIVFSKEHRPMKISKNSFENLFEFVDLFPHYFIGSNADLPIVGGSILSHDHYQAGNHTFPMQKAELEHKFLLDKFKNVTGHMLKWPMSVILLSSKNKVELCEAANYIFTTWKEYSDAEVEILAYTDETPHNTVTPIVKKNGDTYNIYLVLRNNRTSEKYPLGIFHPHNEVHNIKKENIGLIEVMGLAVLPGRLQSEMSELSEILNESNWEEILLNDKSLNKHYNWISDIKKNINEKITLEILKNEIGKTFSTVLSHAGVFKRDEKGSSAFKKFISNL